MGETLDLTKAKDANQVGKSTATKSAVKTDKKNAKGIKAKVAAKVRETMYIYPGDCTTGPEKKKFRASARKKLAMYTKKLRKAAAADKPALLAKAEKFARKTYTKEHMPKFA